MKLQLKKISEVTIERRRSVVALAGLLVVVATGNSCKSRLQYDEAVLRGNERTLGKQLPDVKGLITAPGYMQFMQPSVLTPFLQNLPQVEDPEVQALLYDKATMWYDNNSMIFAYQDSQETVVGIRANAVGHEVGMRNRNNRDIFRLTHYFQPGGFKFPFFTSAGIDDSPKDDVRVLTFWRPGRDENGMALPVKYWTDGGKRRRWRWVFPNGTFFGEVFFSKAPDGRWVCFEVRTRQRYSDGWAVNLFRPFTTAAQFSSAIKSARANWESDTELKALVTHLDNPATLESKTIKSEAYAKIFDGLSGGMDYLPAVSDASLLIELMRSTPFKSQEGVAWKRSGDLEAYAPSTKASFHIIPKDYTAGLIAVNEVSCARCHEDTGRRLGELDGPVVLYGEMWGEDRIFTWHLFEHTTQMFGTFDGSRRINSRMVTAKLVSQGKPGAGDTNYYKELPIRFPQTYF